MVPDRLARARRAMGVRNYEAALREADASLTRWLQPGLGVEGLLHFGAQGAPPDALLSLDQPASSGLAESLAIRWEALHRMGRFDEARRVQDCCMRLWPHRASVWATAGNHALDRDRVAFADRCFQRALSLSPTLPAGLAGRAIVCERRHAWAEALEHRRALVDAHEARERADPVSLQRCVRLAAALARHGALKEASRVACTVIQRGGMSRLPAERVTLVRLVSEVAPAPAALVRGLASVGGLTRPLDPSALHVLADAVVLAQARPRTLRDKGLVAWLAGDAVHAFDLLDRAEEEELEFTLADEYRLWDAALACGDAAHVPIFRFALSRARAAYPDAEGWERHHAALLLAQATPSEMPAHPPLTPPPLLMVDTVPDLDALEHWAAIKAFYECRAVSPPPHERAPTPTVGVRSSTRAARADGGRTCRAGDPRVALAHELFAAQASPDPQAAILKAANRVFGMSTPTTSWTDVALGVAVTALAIATWAPVVASPRSSLSAFQVALAAQETATPVTRRLRAALDLRRPATSGE